MALPVEVDDLTANWFAAVLGRDVAAATPIDRSSGTTGRVRIALEGGPGTPPTVFVKLPPFDPDQRALVDLTGMGVAEARFYRDLAAEVPVRVPAVWFAETDGHGYVMVLEDLVASGCRFPSTDDPDVAARARDIIEQLAHLHAHFWGSARFAPGGDLDWLAPRAAAGGDVGRRFIRQAVDVIGASMDDAFHRIADLYLTHAETITRLWADGEGTLVHGDSHMGNLFVDVDAGGTTGFLDWAVLCRARGMRDIAYVLCNSLPTPVRESDEHALVEHYCKALAIRDIRLDPREAWDQYRLFALYSWVAATATAGMGSKWQAADVGLAATHRATAACTDLDSAGLIESLLR
jgi:aminoglycoside phosphotransferase (APT) family kinase protein